MSETECKIIEDCPDFMYGCCQKYLDGDCSAHKCDLKIIRELQQKLQEKEKECEELKQWKKDAANLFKTQTANADKIISRYKQALDEIEYQTKELFWGVENKDRLYCEKILDIISKAKEK